MQDLLDFDAALRGEHLHPLIQGEEQVAVAVARVRNREDKDPAALPLAVLVPAEVAAHGIAVYALRQAGVYAAEFS